MAGQGECCAHIASVLFYLETFNRVRGKLACTELKFAWIIPSYVKNVPYSQVENIDFTSARNLKQKLDVSIDNLDSSKGVTLAIAKQGNPEIAPPSPGELSDFYAKLNSCNTKPVLLSLIPPYSQSFTTKITELWNGLKFLYRRHTHFLLLPRPFSSKNSVGT